MGGLRTQLQHVDAEASAQRQLLHDEVRGLREAQAAAARQAAEETAEMRQGVALFNGLVAAAQEAAAAAKEEAAATAREAAVEAQRVQVAAEAEAVKREAVARREAAAEVAAVRGAMEREMREAREAQEVQARTAREALQGVLDALEKHKARPAPYPPCTAPPHTRTHTAHPP